MSEWIECNLPYDDYDCPEDSFRRKGLNKPGTLIETENGVFLIGHINPLRGVCDDCTEFPIETIIRRYKIIWREEGENE